MLLDFAPLHEVVRALAGIVSQIMFESCSLLTHRDVLLTGFLCQTGRASGRSLGGRTVLEEIACEEAVTTRAHTDT